MGIQKTRKRSEFCYYTGTRRFMERICRISGGMNLLNKSLRVSEIEQGCPNNNKAVGEMDTRVQRNAVSVAYLCSVIEEVDTRASYLAIVLGDLTPKVAGIKNTG